MSQSTIDTNLKHTALVLDEEMQLLKDSAREFLKEKSPVSALRELRDKGDENGFSIESWQMMVEMGWGSLTFSEAYGGLDFGYLGLGIIMEEMGRTLNASPMIPSVLMSGTAITLGGTEAQKAELLPAIAMGERLITMAIDEGPRHNPNTVNCTVQKTENGYILNGTKTLVIDGHVADGFMVSARHSENEVSLFLVNRQTEGVSVEKLTMVDSRYTANIHFNNVKVEDRLGDAGDASKVLSRTLDIARIGISAELFGVLSEAFDRSINYLKERHQFGVPIGVFQALQHRAAIMFCEIEMCQSVVMKSLQAIDNQVEDLALLASLTKAKVSQTAQLVTNEAIQFFGGIGMTDDEEIGFFIKRARVLQQMLGDQYYHQDRFAELRGY